MYFTYKQRCSVHGVSIYAMYESYKANYSTNQVPIKRNKATNANNIDCLSNIGILS